MNLKEKIEQNSIPVTETGCWLWMAYVDTYGYGRLRVAQRTCKAHRISWQLYKGYIPNDLMVLHKCDVRSCCNPDHLFLGTARTNSKDMIRKRRHKRHNQTHCIHGHEFTPENTYLSDCGKHRHCIQCGKKRGRFRSI